MNLNSSNYFRNDGLSVISAIFNRRPELLYKNPYINFLREFRVKHLDLEIPELYHEGANAWSKLSNKEKKPFRYLDVIRAIKQRRAIKEKRAQMAKKRFRRKIFSPRRIMRRNKRKLYPITKTKGRRQRRRRNQIDKTRRNLLNKKQPTERELIDRLRRTFARIRLAKTRPKMRGSIRKRSQQQRQQRRRRRRRVPISKRRRPRPHRK